MTTPRRSIAVIGSGVAGLMAAYVLSFRDNVTLFEADTRLGGHAHTHHLDPGDGSQVAVDSAFLVHNDRTYPTLCRLFTELGIQTTDTDMSMSVRADEAGLEYAGARGLGGLFPTWRAMTRPRYLAMLTEVKKFHRAATALLRSDDTGDPETVASFLARHNFSPYFTDHFMTPLVAAVWSCAPGDALRYPARYLFVFLEHHGMLTVFGSPTWRTVTGGSATYVNAIAERVHEVRLESPVRGLTRTVDGVQFLAGDQPQTFDAAVVATHPDQALRLLAAPTDAERRILGAIPYSTNEATLHTDESVLPRHRRARASWNYLVTPNSDDVVVTYDVTRLMRLSSGPRYLVTLGGRDVLSADSVITQMTYQHPIYTPESVAAQHLLPTLNDQRVAFAGAYHGWGFHEDGAASGLKAAENLGGQWVSEDAAIEETVPC